MCGGQTSRKSEPYCKQDSQRRFEIADGDAAILGLRIGEASLEDVQAKLGKSEPVRVSKEEESDIALCYLSATDGTLLVFYSGSMGGWKDVTRFSLWSREAAHSGYSKCPRSTEVSRYLSTASGLRLGLTEEQVRKLAGAPTGRTHSTIEYDYLCRQKMTEEEIKGFKTRSNWDVTSDPYSIGHRGSKSISATKMRPISK